MYIQKPRNLTNTPKPDISPRPCDRPSQDCVLCFTLNYRASLLTPLSLDRKETITMIKM